MGNQSASSAMSRITALLDESSFVEIGRLVEARSTDFNLAEKKAPSDGVVTGYGTIDGNLVYVYAQDKGILGGSIGEMHAKKIAGIYSMAMKNEAPVISLIECSGVRLEEAQDGLFGLGRIYKKMSLASGKVPQITAVFGNMGGGLSVLAGLSDFILMEEKDARLYINAPDGVKGNKDEKISMSEAKLKDGTVDFSGSEEDILSEIRKLISILPGSNSEGGVDDECLDDLNRSVEGIEKLTAEEALKILSDNGNFIETKKGYSKDMKTGLAQIGGRTVGLIKSSDKLTWKGCLKAKSLINFCNSFDLPVITITETDGFMNMPCTEEHMARAAAELAYSYSNADIPLITVIRKAYGSAGLLMGSKALGADVVLCYPDSEIGVMDAEKASELLSDNGSKEEIRESFREKNGVYASARRGYIDDIISPEETRQRIAASLQMLSFKSVYRPDKKNGTV